MPDTKVFNVSYLLWTCPKDPAKPVTMQPLDIKKPPEGTQEKPPEGTQKKT